MKIIQNRETSLCLVCCGVVVLLVLIHGISGQVAAQNSKTAAKPPTKVANRLVTENGRTQHPLVPALRIAGASLKTISKITDFEATFRKNEQINGQMTPLSMRMKFRRKPMSVYLLFEKPHTGREVIYVTGKNNGNLLAHETGIRGIVGTVALHPTSAQAMADGRHPITEIGMEKMLAGVISQWQAESKYGEIDVKYYPDAKLGSMQCNVIESSHPRPRRQFKFHKTRLFLDKKTNLPVRVEQFGFPPTPQAAPPLIEEYTYSNIKANVGLKNFDFDPRNPKYGF